MSNKISSKKLAYLRLVILIILVAAVCQAVEVLAKPLAGLQSASATRPLILTDEVQKYPLGLNLDILEDPTGDLNIGEVSSPAYDSQFVPNEASVPNYGFTHSAYWIRFSLDNQTTQITEWLLEQGFANTQYIDLYLPRSDGQGFDVKQTGALRPVSTRDILYPKIVFSIDLSPQSSQTYYLRISGGASMTIPLTLWTKDAFIVSSGRILILQGLFFGALLALLGYHLFFLITLRETVYLYFMLLVVSTLAVLLEYTGYLGAYVFPNLYFIKPYSFPVFYVAFGISIALFSDNFLQLKARHPKLHQINLSIAIIWGVGLLIIPFAHYLTLARLMNPVLVITFATTFMIGLYSWQKGFRPMGFFLLAWLGMSASFIVVLLVRLTILPSTYFTENLYELGFIFMAVSWSIALADRINLFKTQTDQANRNLLQSESRLSQILEGLPLGVVVYGKDQKAQYINKRTAEILTNPDKGIHPDVDAGRTLAQSIEHFSFHVAGTERIYPVEKFPVFQALKGAPVFADDIEINDGERNIPLEMWASPVRDDLGNVESAIAAFQDITTRKEADNELDRYRKNLEELVRKRTAELRAINTQLDREVEERKNLEQSMLQRIEWLSAMNEIHQSLIGKESIHAAYEQLSDTILKLLGTRTIFIMHWDEQDRPVNMHCRSVIEHPYPPLDAMQQIFAKGTLLRQELENQKLLLFSAEQAAALPSPLIDCLKTIDYQALVLSLMQVGQADYGILAIATSKSVEDLAPYELSLMKRMTYDLTHLMDDAILLDQRRALATMEERNHLARELHDSVAQALYGVSLFTDATRLAFESNRPEIVRQYLDDLKEISQEAMSDMRMLIFELRPPILDEQGLAAALQSRLDAVESRAGVKALLSVDGNFHLTTEQESELYRIAQEALNNAVKHAHATQVRVSLAVQNDIFQMMIEDDGVGFDPKAAEQAGGQGFRNIRERAEIIGAKYSIISKIGDGTKIIVKVKQ